MHAWSLRAAKAAELAVVAIPNPAYPPDPDVLLEAEVVLDSIADLAAAVFARDQRGPASLP